MSSINIPVNSRQVSSLDINRAANIQNVVQVRQGIERVHKAVIPARSTTTQSLANSNINGVRVDLKA